MEGATLASLLDVGARVTEGSGMGRRGAPRISQDWWESDLGAGALAGPPRPPVTILARMGTRRAITRVHRP